MPELDLLLDSDLNEILENARIMQLSKNSKL